MTKNFFGGATINSGPTLPLVSETPDGSLFYKTSAPSGLYFFGFNPDANSGLFGDQTTQGWTVLVDTSGASPYVLKTGDTLTGNLSGTAFRAAQGVPTGDGSVNGFAFGGDGDTGLFSVGSGAIGTSVSLYLNNVERLQLTASTATIGGSNIWTAASLTSLSQLVNSPGYITAGYFSGGLPVSSGGTGQAGGLTQGGVIYSATTAQMASTVAGSLGLLLQSGGTGSPSWINPNSLNVATAVSANTANSATTASQLSPGRNINGVLFDGTSNITVAAAAGTLTGTTLPATVVNSSLVSVGTLANLTVTNPINGSTTLNVLKSGDTMTGGLYVPSIAVGSVSMSGSGSMNLAGDITAFGFINSLSNITSTGGNITATSGYVRAGSAGSVGLVQLQSSGSGNSGYIEFYGLNQVRAGYIGNTGTVGSTDAGTINYVANAGHSFTGAITSNGNITAFSDRRLKSNITTITDPIYKVQQLEGVNFNRKGFEERFTGLIAQDVQAVMPEAVMADTDGMLSVAYGNLVGLLVEAIKAQQSEIDELKSMVRAMLKG